MADKKPVTFVRELACELTDLELKTKSGDLAREIHDLEKTQAEAKSAAGAAREKIKQARDRIHDLKDVVLNRREFRLVTCYEVKRYEEHAVDLVREDTGEVFFTRAMTDADRQGELIPLAGGKDKAAVAGGEKPAPKGKGKAAKPKAAPAPDIGEKF